MSLRAIIIGLLFSLLLAGFGYINDHILLLESLTAGHQLPVVVLGFLFLLLIFLNPLLFRLRRKLSLQPRELAVIVVLAMIACSIPGRGLMDQFTQLLVMPHQLSRVNPGWRQHKLMEYAPEKALVRVIEETHERVVTTYIMGAHARDSRDDQTGAAGHLAGLLAGVPWEAWLAPLLIWLPMLFLSAAAVISMSLIAHRQWSRHELLSYPIADFTATLIERKPGEMMPLIFRNRLFWTGFTIFCLIRVNNGLCVWFPDVMVPVSLSWSFAPMRDLWPELFQVQWAATLLRIDVFPLVVAFAFFLSSEISLTLGLSQWLWAFVAYPMNRMGIDLQTTWVGGWSGWQRAGSYLAYFIALMYTGRQYFREVLTGAFTGRGKRADIWSCRVFLFSILALVFLINRLGLELPLAMIFVFLTMLSFLIVGRISAETGLFFVQPRWMALGVMMAMFGSYAMPPRAIVITGLAGLVLCADPSQSLMPYLVNGLKVGERFKLNLHRLGGLGLGSYVAGVILAVVVVLAALYEFGTPTGYNWSYSRLPSIPFSSSLPAIMQLSGQGLLEQAEQTSWAGRISGIAPYDNFLWAFSFGFVAVAIFSILRLRLAKWPLHPVLFLLWATYPMATTHYSFLIGWMLKRAVVRYAGQPTVHKLKPLMIGVIAGEITGALVFVIAGAVYYQVTGDLPQRYSFFPR